MHALLLEGAIFFVFKGEAVSFCAYIFIAFLLVCGMIAAHYMLKSEQSKIKALNAREWHLQEKFFPVMIETRSIQQETIGDNAQLTRFVYETVVWIGGLIVLGKLASQIEPWHF